MKIYFYRASDTFWPFNDAVIRGFIELGHEVFSNVPYPPIIERAVKLRDSDKYEAIIVATNAGDDTDFYPDRPYIFLESIHTQSGKPFNKIQLSRANYYFKLDVGDIKSYKGVVTLPSYLISSTDNNKIAYSTTIAEGILSAVE
jgi:hypothetical protein